MHEAQVEVKASRRRYHDAMDALEVLSAELQKANELAAAARVMAVAPGDHHGVLNLAADATPKQAKKAYKRMRGNLDPERSSAPDAAAAFERLEAAYKALGPPPS